MEKISSILKKYEGIAAYVFLLAISIMLVRKLFPQYNFNLLAWDAGWYKDIVKNGYIYAKGMQCNVAFFPLFPLTWKFIGLSSLGVSILNFLLLITGMVLLVNAFDIKPLYQFLYLSSFSMFFCYVPYSEAFFFVSISMFFYGMQKNNIYMRYAGLLLAGITRSVSFLFIPIVIISEILVNGEKKMKEILCLCAILLLCIGIVVAIQYYFTGHFFIFLEVQKEWDRVFSIPHTLFSTFGNHEVLFFDASSLFLTAFAGLIFLVFFINTIKGKEIMTDKSFVYSSLYLIAMGLVAIFYSGMTSDGYSKIYSIKIVLFATPVMIIFLKFIKFRIKFKIFSVFNLVLTI